MTDKTATLTSNLVARLRAEAEDANSNSDEANAMMCEAADEIERLTRELTDEKAACDKRTRFIDKQGGELVRLRAALEPPNKEYAQSIVQQALGLWGKPRGVKLGAETQEWLLRIVGIGSSDETRAVSGAAGKPKVGL